MINFKYSVDIIVDCQHIPAYFRSILAISYNNMLAIIE